SQYSAGAAQYVGAPKGQSAGAGDLAVYLGDASTTDRQGVAVEVDRTGDGVAALGIGKPLVAREGQRQADHRGIARGDADGHFNEQPGGQRDGVAGQLITRRSQVNGVERRAGGEVVDVRGPGGAEREDEVVAGLRGDVARPIGGGGPPVVGAAAVPGGHGRGE